MIAAHPAAGKAGGVCRPPRGAKAAARGTQAERAKGVLNGAVAADIMTLTAARPRRSVMVVQARRKRMILGIGLDNEDEQVRVTRGPNFRLVGGSHDTHASMQEKCVKFNEKLDDRGKSLDDLAGEEFHELAQECEMNVVTPREEP
jgi:hypothetical protein